MYTIDHDFILVLGQDRIENLFRDRTLKSDTNLQQTEILLYSQQPFFAGGHQTHFTLTLLMIDISNRRKLLKVLLDSQVLNVPLCRQVKYRS